LLLAGFGVAVAFMLSGILAAVIRQSDWADVSIMIGLGVWIDYALICPVTHGGGPSLPRSPRIQDRTRALSATCDARPSLAEAASRQSLSGEIRAAAVNR
jgi:hypothetical protein